MTEKTHHVTEKKKTIAKNVQKLILDYPIIAVVNMENLPTPQLQQMKARLRDKIEITMTKRRVMKHAIEGIKDKKKNIEKLEEHLKGMPALIFTKENPFSLFKTLKKSKTSAPAKAGQIAPFDLKIPHGPTGFAPGPVIGELAQLGIKSGVEGGKVVIKEDSIIVKEGGNISAKAAEILTRLGIKPMEVGLNVTAVYENGDIFTASILDIDEEKFMKDLQNAALGSFNLAVNSGYTTKDTINALIGKAFNDAKALGLSQDIIDEGIIKELLSKAEGSALSLKSTVKVETVEKPRVEEKKEEPKPEVKKQEAKEEPAPAEKKEEKVLEEEKKIVEEEKKLEKKEEPKIEAPVEKEVEEEVKEEEEKQLEKERIEKEKELEKVQEQRKVEELKRKEEQKKAEEERKKQEEARKKEEEQKKKEEEAKRKKVEEDKRKAEKAKIKEEKKKVEEERRILEEERKLEEEAKKQQIESVVEEEVKEEEEKQLEKERIEKEGLKDTDKKIAEMVAKTKKFVKGEIPDAEKLIEEAGKLAAKEIKKEEPKVAEKEKKERVPLIQELKERKKEKTKKEEKEQKEVEDLAQELIKKGTLRK